MRTLPSVSLPLANVAELNSVANLSTMPKYDAYVTSTMVRRGMSSRQRVLFRGLILLAILTGVATLAVGQGEPNLDTGTKPFGSYYGGQFDSVSTVNGTLTADIPLMSYPQRGGQLGLNFALHYQNRGFYRVTECSPCFSTWYWAQSGFMIVDRDDLQVIRSFTSFPYGNSSVVWFNYGIYSSDGSYHALGNTVGSAYESVDATGLHFDSSTFLITDSRAIRYSTYPPTQSSPTSSSTSPCADGVAPKPYGPVPEYVGFKCEAVLREDANGNKISFSSTTGWT